MTEIIRTENISKRYKEVNAISDMSLNVGKGEIYGFLGLNGAGKTTTIRMLLGMVRPSSGIAFINGIRVSADRQELWKRTGSLVEIPYSYPELTVRENLEIIRRLRLIQDRQSVDRVIDKLKLGACEYKKAKHLSLGNSQRLGLAKALIHDPDILILDEPTNGLDPAGIYEIREMLRNLALNRGVTVFISSHILGEISRFATRIGIIHEGRLVQELEAGQLEALCRKRLRVESRDLEKACSALVQHGYQVMKTSASHLVISDDRALSRPDDVATILVSEGCPPTLLHVEEEDLEAYFLRTVGAKGEVQ